MLQQAIDTFVAATSLITPEYMSLQRAEQDAQPLERVYSYELYHRLRTLWRNEHYSWGGEVDKAGHLHFRHPNLRNRKPDLLLHRPGDHTGNLLIIEIKMAMRINRNNVCDDLQTLTTFRQNNAQFQAYAGAVFLLVGGQRGDVDRVVDWAETARPDRINTRLIDFYWHSGPGRPAQLQPW